MAKFPHSFVQLSDQDLLAEVKRLSACERQATVSLIASLMEVDARRLCRGEGCSSLFTYCTQVLHLSEHAAYRRIEAARAARRFPSILELLAEGAITLTTVGLLAPHLTADNHLEFHHVMPFASVGPAVVENIELRCAAHNAHEAELYVGPRQPPLVRESAPLHVLG